MSGFSVRDVMRADAAGVSVGGPAAGPRTGVPRPLGPLAELVAARPVPRTLSPEVVAGCVRAAEAVAVVLAGVGMQLAYLGAEHETRVGYALGSLGLGLATVVAFEVLGLYALPALRAPHHRGARLAAGWAAAFGVAAGLIFFLRLGQDVSRVWLAGTFVAGFLAVAGVRGFAAAAVRSAMRSGRLTRRVVLVGGGEEAERIIRALEEDGTGEAEVLGVFDDRGDGRSSPTVAGRPKLGSVDDLVEFARRTRVDVVVFTLPITAEARILGMLRKVAVLPIDVRLSAHASKLRLRPRAYSYLAGAPLLDLFDKPITGWGIVLKVAFDRVVGVLLLLLASPLMLAAALAVRLDSPGPILFRQRRYGFNNELIEVLKFRSMRVEACDPAATKLVTRGDPRVTRVGAFLRRTSIDELPQLINVALFGNLSLVGPRPHALQAKAEDRLYDEVVDGYFARHRVKPGITGWAQVNGWRGETDTHEKIQRRVEHDLYYIENWSLGFDVRILVLTPLALIRPSNAY